jgi:hexosaminidase
LQAPNQWGALRGLETFSQLVWWAGNDVTPNAYNITSLPIFITDAPRFPWRGTLIDTSRHYLSVPTILSVLDAMSYSKMNRLHWHVVDDDSWPLQSVRYPLFTKGAYEKAAIYTHADVQTIVQYAWQRGIQVIPEFDLPAHAQAWGTGYPDLLINCPGDQPLANPLPNSPVYSTVIGLLQEFLPLFAVPGQATADFVHFGGDEVQNLDCWAQDPSIQAFMKQQGYTDINQVRTYFQTTLQQIAANFTVSPVFWEEVFDGNYLPNQAAFPNTTVDVWLSDDELISVLKTGYRAIESFGLYLDQQTPDGDTHYFWVDTILNFWQHDPLLGRTLTPAQTANLLGLSQSQWGEQVNDASIATRMWPRTLGGAERMWSPALTNYTPPDNFFWRVDRAACHYLRRGIATSPIRPSDQTVYCALPLPTTTGGDYSFSPKRINWDENREEEL